MGTEQRDGFLELGDSSFPETWRSYQYGRFIKSSPQGALWEDS